jgi:uncharacterized membrane protein YkvA (DUF1232 family)
MVQQLGISARPKPALEPQASSSYSSRWKAHAERLQRELMVIWFILRRPGTPWPSRMIAGFVVAYVLSPVQLIPSFIPVIGLLDDAAVIAAGLALIRVLTPKNIMQDARNHAQTALKHGENIRPVAVRATTVIVAGAWLALTICLFFILRR